MASVFKGLYSTFIYSKPYVQQFSVCRRHGLWRARTIIDGCNSYHTSKIFYKRRKSSEERKAPRIIEFTPKAKNKSEPIGIWKNMTVTDLAAVMNRDLDHVFEVMLYVDKSDEYSDAKSKISNLQVIQDIIKKSGMKAKIVAPPENNTNNKLVDRDAVPQPPANPTDLRPRPPVVTVMGHVDHGKTTLLDSLRNTSVVDSEFGGITQHIGAFSVTLDNGSKITFLDTPGHAAFKAMRERGAHVTDLVVLVVAADDGVMEQTVESIRMAKEANVPIIVAINKIDKPEADIDRATRMLSQYGLQTESTGGDIQAVPISALKGTNLTQLTEAIAVQAELLELKACPTDLVEGTIIESCVDAYRGKLSTVLIQRGTLSKGSVLVAGTAWAKVRALFDQDGRNITEAPPSTAVEMLGWRELPAAGQQVLEVISEKRAHEVVKWREAKQLEERRDNEAGIIKAKQDEHLVAYRAQLEHKRKIGRYRLKPGGPREKEIKEDTTPTVRVVVKGDVDGTVEAILDVLETYDSNTDCKLDVVHYGVGNISESDVELATVFNAIIYGFNIECPSKVEQVASTKNIPMKMHNVIYKLVDDLKEEINKKLPQKEAEEILGEANVLQQFVINEGKKKIPIAGCRCVKGTLKKQAKYRVVRDNDIIYEGSLESMRHLKNEVESIKKDVECGLQFDENTFEFKPGDTILCYELKMVPQQTHWDPGF
ncbi:mitochondrial translation initiation factor 2 [Carabus blaptoides fortunei]